MKRLLPNSLVTFLQATPACVKADCFIIELPTGEYLYATEGQWDITFLEGTPGWSGGQKTFRSSQYGKWSRGRIVSEATTKASPNTMTLTCVPQADTTYPGLSLGILNAALNHLFDGTNVWVYTAYMPIGSYGNVSNGVEPKWFGTITKSPVLSRLSVQFECADPMFFLNLKVPTRLMQADCPYVFCDANCSLSADNYAVNFTAASGSTQRALTPVTTFTQPAGYFAQGVVLCVSGQNAGLSNTVKIHTAGILTVMVPWLLPIAAGDTFSVIKGCDKTVTTCAATTRANGTAESQNFQIRFGGTPFAPPPTTAL